jgi:hypothetical protein
MKPQVIFIIATVWFFIRPTTYYQFVWEATKRLYYEEMGQYDAKDLMEYERQTGKKLRGPTLELGVARGSTVGRGMGRTQEDARGEGIALLPPIVMLFLFGMMLIPAKDVFMGVMRIIYLVLGAGIFARYLAQAFTIHTDFQSRNYKPAWSYLYLDVLVLGALLVFTLLALPEVIKQVTLKKEVSDELERLRKASKKA